ncbi:MAG TPA: hypothetical protein GX505_05640 [Clostridiales bacterium]|nr:hypothetical protein [Clostridiales bacterium]
MIKQQDKLKMEAGPTGLLPPFFLFAVLPDVTVQYKKIENYLIKNMKKIK